MRKIKIETPEMEPLAISQEQAKARYNMGTYMIDKVAGDAKAIVRIVNRFALLSGIVGRFRRAFVQMMKQ